MKSPQGKRIRTFLAPVAAMTLLVTGLSGVTGPSPGSLANAGQPETGPPGGAASVVEAAELVEVRVADADELDRLLAIAPDVDTVETDAGRLTVHAAVTPTERQALADHGFELGAVLYDVDDWRDRIAERETTMADNRAANEAFSKHADEKAGATAADAIEVLRVDYFESRNGAYLSVEAKSSTGQDDNAPLTVYYNGDLGRSQTLNRFVDAGVYMYHRGLAQVTSRPSFVVVTGPNGGWARAPVTEWLPPEDPEGRPPLTGFVQQYLVPTELYDRIGQLADEFPDLAEVVELPHRTNGYRRAAQALFSPPTPPGGQTPVQSRVVVDSKAYGHEGGNDITVELADPGEADSALTVQVSGDQVRVVLGTDDTGAIASTAAEVAAALNDHAGSLVTASTFRGAAGDGIVDSAPPTALSDFLSAPDTVSRDPHPVYMLRIGKHRDGSKLGVLAYAQEHAREWVTPLVTVETAERLLRNYGHHEPTTRLLDELDIFILPSVNPDGGHYSFYDSGGQRKNMTNYCPLSGAADPLARNFWGVDNNRNYAAYTRWDGYAGGSTSCTSGTFAGPDEAGPMSQPENRNLIWVADTHPNIRFSMNIHSSGDYFMWSPGAYQAQGRVPAPRPEVDEEAYFWAASASILSAIKTHRGTVVEPGRTGPIIDVLYSAAGNSGDHLWYLNDIYAWNFEVGRAGFQPEWPEAYEQAQEYSDGLYRFLEVAYAFDHDTTAPTSTVEPGPGRYRRGVEVAFEVSEPAAIYYTLDGSRPTFESTRLGSAGVREGAETLWIDRTTTIRWFAIDAAGNIENGYDPDGRGGGYNKARYRITR